MAKGTTKRGQPAARVRVAAEFLSKMRYSEARRALMERFDYNYASASRDLGAAQDLIAAEFSAELPQLKESLLARLNYAMDQAQADRDWSGVVRSVMAIAKIAGIMEPDKIDVTISGGIKLEQLAHVKVLQLTQPQRLHRERELAAREAAHASHASKVIDVPTDGAAAVEAPTGETALVPVAPNLGTILDAAGFQRDETDVDGTGDEDESDDK